MPRRRLPSVGENACNLACRHRAPVEMHGQEDPPSRRMGQRAEHSLVSVQSRPGNSFRSSLQFPMIFSLFAEYCQEIFSIDAKYRISQEMPPCGRSGSPYGEKSGGELSPPQVLICSHVVAAATSAGGSRPLRAITVGPTSEMLYFSSCSPIPSIIMKRLFNDSARVGCAKMPSRMTV